MNNNILWLLKEVDRNSWDFYWSQTNFSNLMQSWGYGEAKKCQGWKPFRFVLLDNFGVERGLLQILAKEVSFFGGIIRINRGPIWFKSDVNNKLDEDELCELWKAIRRHMLSKRWWFISCAPECPQIAESEKALLRAGYRFVKKKIPYGSSKLSLIDNDNDFLFMNLKKKWRNILRKGQKLGITLTEITGKDKIRELVSIHENHQKIKKFGGISSNLLHNMFNINSSSLQMRVYQTLDTDSTQTSGFIFITYTGDTATYLVGWSNEIGRAQQANYLLIWKAIEDANKAGLSWFDLGGLNENTPKGVAHFKNGVNAKSFQNIGEYWSFFSI